MFIDIILFIIYFGSKVNQEHKRLKQKKAMNITFGDKVGIYLYFEYKKVKILYNFTQLKNNQID